MNNFLGLKSCKDHNSEVSRNSNYLNDIRQEKQKIQLPRFNGNRKKCCNIKETQDCDKNLYDRDRKIKNVINNLENDCYDSGEDGEYNADKIQSIESSGYSSNEDNHLRQSRDPPNLPNQTSNRDLENRNINKSNSVEKSETLNCVSVWEKNMKLNGQKSFCSNLSTLNQKNCDKSTLNQILKQIYLEMFFLKKSIQVKKLLMV
ncbi:histone-lysine N-methyltransferase 2A [Caerostris extrusa]|uniref:Histone-lysine N-methyltransferase 2A n=1 Tax=Caerostris extrusa TaxID=172846 RepID=A0AAV4Q4Q2_CAEEX|nr:histone-lysine N-methyltransferase 2A [Caerostris extrusa]